MTTTNSTRKYLYIIKYSIVLATFIHVFEEYKGDFIGYVTKFVPGITLLHFFIINFLFIAYVIFSLFSKSKLIILSVPLLLLINTAIHVTGLLLFQKYNPGVISAVFLYIPLSVFYIVVLKPHKKLLIKSGVIAMLLMIFPFFFQAARILLGIGVDHL